MAVNIHITIIELNALHTKRQNLFQELDAVIHLLMEAKHWGLRKSRNATSLNSRFKSLDTLKVKIISVTFRRVIRTNHKKASKIWRHEIQRLMNAMRQAHADGWFIVFDTLTLADDRLEAFYDNPNALRDYFRDIGRMVLAAEGRKANDSHAD